MNEIKSKITVDTQEQDAVIARSYVPQELCGNAKTDL